jgi:hypothetical protein
MVVNSPANPTGWTASHEDLRGHLTRAPSTACGSWRTRSMPLVMTAVTTATRARRPSWDVMEPDDGSCTSDLLQEQGHDVVAGRLAGSAAALGPVIENSSSTRPPGSRASCQKGAAAAAGRGRRFVAAQIARAREGRRIVCDALRARTSWTCPRPPGPSMRSSGGRRQRLEGARHEAGGRGGGPGAGHRVRPRRETHLRLCFLRSAGELETAAQRLRASLRGSRGAADELHSSGPSEARSPEPIYAGFDKGQLATKQQSVCRGQRYGFPGWLRAPGNDTLLRR